MSLREKVCVCVWGGGSIRVGAANRESIMVFAYLDQVGFGLNAGVDILWITMHDTNSK